MRSCNHCCSRKATRITYSKNVFVALGTQCTCVILLSVAYSPLLSSTLSATARDLRKDLLKSKIFVLIFATTSVCNICNYKKVEWDMITNVCMSSCKPVVILVRFQRNLNFLNRFSKSTQISNFMKILPIEAEMFHADRRTYTYTAKLIVAFRNFAKAPKMRQN